ncbi:hypothetical protein ACFL2V_11060 [Pseudomonadota bacterium]
MNINLSWDLFIVVFIGIVTAYSFIIGRDQTLKVVAGTYVAILCSDAMGNLFDKYLASSETFLKLLKIFSIGDSDQATAFFKVIVLILLIVLIAVRGRFQFYTDENNAMTTKVFEVLALGVLTGALMISAMLIYISGNSLVSDSITNFGIATEIYEQSKLVRLMIDGSNFWFMLPGLGIIAVGLFSKKTA